MLGLNEIRKLINVEEKVKNVTVTSVTTSSSGTIDLLTAIGQGTDINQRVGDSIRCQKLTYSLLCTRNGTDGCVRAIIFRDTENQGSTPSATDLLEAVSGTLSIVTPYTWFNHNSNAQKNRFVILLDDVLTVSSSEPNAVISVKFSQNEMKHTRFRGTTDAASSSAEGALFLLIITDQAANQPKVTWYSRLTYTDD